MSRQARIVLPGELHHITQRGNYRQRVFFDDQDRAVYLKYLDFNAKKYGVLIYAFCLMDNHVHFLVKPIKAESLAKTFRITHQRYSLYLNNRLNEYGHRWQSRYYSCVVLGTHIPTAVRYVEQNPVRARMVACAWHYPWSSAKAHTGKKYKIIALADIKEYVNIDSWKDFLSREELEEDLKVIRITTKQGRIYGPSDIIEHWQNRFKQKLTFQPKGRPRSH